MQPYNPFALSNLGLWSFAPPPAAPAPFQFASQAPPSMAPLPRAPFQPVTYSVLPRPEEMQARSSASSSQIVDMDEEDGERCLGDLHRELGSGRRVRWADQETMDEDAKRDKEPRKLETIYEDEKYHVPSQRPSGDDATQWSRTKRSKFPLPDTSQYCFFFRNLLQWGLLNQPVEDKDGKFRRLDRNIKLDAELEKHHPEFRVCPDPKHARIWEYSNVIHTALGARG